MRNLEKLSKNTNITDEKLPKSQFHYKLTKRLDKPQTQLDKKRFGII